VMLKQVRLPLPNLVTTAIILVKSLFIIEKI
jgi:hypothetical protein